MNQMGDQAKNFTNIYVKNFANVLSEAKLKEMFNPFGNIVSCKVGLGVVRNREEVYRLKQ